VAPDVLGLPPTIGTGEAVVERVRRQMVEALAAGQDERFRGLALGLYLAGHRASDICDLAIAPAFSELGERWEHSELAIYQERRGVEIALRLLHELRKILPPPAADAPLAIGGTLAGDPYTVANTMAELALREAGWRAESCGAGLPAATFAAAIRELRPRLAWCSASTTDTVTPEHLGESMPALVAAARATGAVLVMGGRALDAAMRARLDGVIVVDTLRQLVTLAQALQNAGPGGERQP
jgi:methanogenic corrinoid protein MtbC1